MRRHSAALILPVTIVLVATAAPLGPTISTYVGPDGGGWNNPANWSDGIVPDNGPFDVFINDGGPDVEVILDTTVDISALTIDAGDQLTMNSGGFDLFIDDTGPIQNDGTILLDTSSAIIEIVSRVPELMISGTGEIVFGLSQANRLTTNIGDQRIINGADHTIRGSGSIGVNLIDLTNNGLIEADNTSSPMVLDLRGGGSFNNGTLRARSASELEILSSTIDNTNGLVEAIENSVVSLVNAEMIGGMYSTDDTGTISLDGGSTVLFDAVNNGTMVVGETFDPDLSGTFTNNGTLSLPGQSAISDLTMISNPMTFTGPGTLFLTHESRSRLTGNVSDTLLINDTDHTIRGLGDIGVNILDIQNDGHIIADGPGETLRFNPRGGGSFNNNTMRAQDGGNLLIDACTLDNSAGLIESMPGSTVTLTAPVILGGTLRSQAGSDFIINNGSTVLSNVTLEGPGIFRVLNTFDPDLEGTIDCNTELSLEGNGGLTDLTAISSPCTLTGGGSIGMNGPTARLTANISDTLLIIDADFTIRGQGALGVNIIDVQNDGFILADVPSEILVFDGRGEGTVNNNVMRAESGGILRLDSMNLDNANGEITADDGSIVDLNGTLITGGILSTNGTGEIQISNGATRLTDVVNNGRVVVQNTHDPDLEGTLTNNDVFIVDGNGGLTDLTLAGDVLVDGTGIMEFGPTGRLTGTFSDTVFTHAAGHTIRGDGELGLNIVNINNHGLIESSGDGTMSLDGRSFFDNHGQLFANNVGGIDLHFPFTQLGVLNIAEESRIQMIGGDFEQDAGLTTVLGELECVNVTVEINLNGGILQGTGLIDGVVNNGASIAPGTSAGTLNVEGDYHQSASGTLAIELGGLAPGDEHDVLAVDGDVTLAGALTVDLIDGFVPQIGDAFTILTATGTITGTFDEAPCGAYTIQYLENTVVLTAVGINSPADLNCDGVVNTDDLLLLLASWGMCPKKGACVADIDDDGAVDVNDLLILLAEWS